MLALITNRDDLTADWLVLELHRRAATFVRVNSEDFPEHSALEWTDVGARLEMPDVAVDADEITAVWWRRSVAPLLDHEDRTPAEAVWAAGEARLAWDGFWQTVEAHWVNHPAANAYADRKPVQLRAAQRLGFTLPATLITNDTDLARRFVGQHASIICKALHTGVIADASSDDGRLLYTQRLTADMMEALDGLGPEPYLFQELVPKDSDVRVTVIGDDVFACRIDSQRAAGAEVDWRLGELDDLAHRPIDLPEGIAERCRQLAHNFGLRFAAIDLAITPEGDYVFFEINPNGQWAWIEQLTGQPLRAALADELQRA